MKRIHSRKIVTPAGLMVEEIDQLAGEIVCKMYRKGKATKFWSPAASGFSS